MNCAVPGCKNTTRESKPFCPDHVEEHPYVAGIVAELDAREEEIALVEKDGAIGVRLAGTVVDDLLRHLDEIGARTVQRLHRERMFKTNVAVTTIYVEAMAEAGLVTLGRTKRGSVVVHPVTSQLANR